MDFLTGGMGLKTKDRIIAVLLVVLAVILFVGGQVKKNHEEFTKEKWENYEGNSRQTILDDFADRTNVNGMTLAEVKDMLGEPEEETETFLTYYLGMPIGLFGTKMEGETEYLVFHLEDGVVTNLEKTVADRLPEDSVYHPIYEEMEGSVFYPSEQ